jgi:hypothetical protein
VQAASASTELISGVLKLAGVQGEEVPSISEAEVAIQQAAS